MRSHRTAGLLAASIVLIPLLLVSPLWGDSSRGGGGATPPFLVDTKAPSPDALIVQVMVDFDEQYEIEAEAARARAYLAEQQRLVDAYLAALEAERVEAERQAALARAAASRSSVSVQRASVSGDCAEVAAVVGSGTVQRESGGNPGATNGIYLGCAQIGTPWWNGACSGLNWTNVSDQAECARIMLRLQGPSAWATTWGG